LALMSDRELGVQVRGRRLQVHHREGHARGVPGDVGLGALAAGRQVTGGVVDAHALVAQRHGGAHLHRPVGVTRQDEGVDVAGESLLPEGVGGVDALQGAAGVDRLAGVGILDAAVLAEHLLGVHVSEPGPVW
ncbi:MAG: hypothetical protein HYZ81_11190, partial [Nitrospinae bacterium]|nr:hypothetical protein [Nitrospinota bacterium]